MPRRTITSYQRVRARAAADADFRAHVLEDGRAVQYEWRLSDAEWHRLFVEVEQIEARLEFDPSAPTEADHGEEDAAGVKN